MFIRIFSNKKMSSVEVGQWSLTLVLKTKATLHLFISLCMQINKNGSYFYNSKYNLVSEKALTEIDYNPEYLSL